MVTVGNHLAISGATVKIYDIFYSLQHDCDVAVGAIFTKSGTFISAETWRASDGRYFILYDRESRNDIDVLTPPSQA